MKRTGLIVISALICLLLSGCGSRAEEQRFSAFSEDLRESGSVSFTAAVRAEYTDRRCDFVLSCDRAGDSCCITVIEPDCIGGIQAVIKGGSASLQYDSIIIDTGALDERGLSPVSAMPLIFDAIEHGFPEAFWDEDGLHCVHLTIDDELSAIIGFEPESYIPVRAELISSGHVIINCKITEWNTKG